MLKPDRPFGTVNLTFGDRLADSENDWYRISPHSQEYQDLLAKQYTGFKIHIDARKKVYVKKNPKLTTFKRKTETQDELKDRKRKAEEATVPDAVLRVIEGNGINLRNWPSSSFRTTWLLVWAFPENKRSTSRVTWV
jgi:hypothetical protein